MKEKINAVLNEILEKFKTGEVPAAIAFACYPSAEIPSAHWSLLNRIIMILAGTADARGFRQWHEAGRRVKKGSKAFFILVPVYRKILDEETEEETKILCYFKPAPVFRYEDTEGDPIDYGSHKLPDLPLLERAQEWGITVQPIPGNCGYYGSFSQERGQIDLASPEECIFFHELSHAAHAKVAGKIKAGQEPLQEIVAELSAQVLCRLVGKKPTDTIGNSHRYIEHYAAKLKLSPHTACLKVLSETEKVLHLILKAGDGSAPGNDAVVSEDGAGARAAPNLLG